ncbi:MAG: C40 family peptidase [Hyphomicrobium sp.]|nr:C40 family peptidase [Hyphomicrobium sp.]
MMDPLGQRVVTAAREWIGTPYHHQASVKGVGADCLGLVRGVFRDVMGLEPETPPAYSRDWGEADGCETLLDAAGRHLSSMPLTELAPGDVIVFRLRPRTVAKHAAILATPLSMIHAMEGTAAAEVAFSPWWRRRLAGVFRFPDSSSR